MSKTLFSQKKPLSTSLRQLSQDELNTIISKHQQWLKTEDDTKAGRADLSKTDLQGHDFAGANLRHVSFQDADLRKANLSGADLTNAEFRGANLENANLTGVIGLLAEQLGDTNLRRAKLPENFTFSALGKVDEISKNAGGLFLSMLAGCAYSWLTIATTTDPHLLTNSATSKLPIIGTEIPIVGFYWIGPLLLLGVYVYFHLYLQRLWETMATLPAIFPDGMTLDRKTHAWLLIDLVRGHFKHLQATRPPLSWLQEKLSELLAWGLVPLTFVWIWMRYLSRHDWPGTRLHIILITASIWASLAFYRLAIATLRANKKELEAWRGPWVARRFYKRGATSLVGGGIFLIFSQGGIEGVPVEELARVKEPFKNPRFWVPVVFNGIRYAPFANFREAKVSTGTIGDAISATGAHLELANLRFANADRAFLAQANLRSAKLYHANLKAAHLQYAHLEGAFLQNAHLEGAHLSNSFLNDAHLQGANLMGADLLVADLSRADFRGADLSGADLRSADIDDANFGFLNLQDAASSNLERCGCPICVRPLQSEASAKNANLRGANLRGVDLRKAIGLTAEQVQVAITDPKTQLPKHLVGTVKLGPFVDAKKTKPITAPKPPPTP